MDVQPDTWAWAEQTFANADLGDPRRTRPLVQSAARIAAHPEKAFTQVFDWNELRGFYRLCDQWAATTAAVQTPHWQQTRQAMSQQPLVLILHDTTELDYSRHHRLAGRGQMGNELGKGFLQHNSLAVLPQPRQVLGLAFQQGKVRQPAPEGETAYRRKRRRRESDLWADGFRGVEPAPEDCCWVDVCDRGSDDYEAVRAARQLRHHVLFRANQNRLVFVTPDQDRQEYLLDYARTLPAAGSDTVDIPGHGRRPPRKWARPTRSRCCGSFSSTRPRCSRCATSSAAWQDWEGSSAASTMGIRAFARCGAAINVFKTWCSLCIC